jgi:hypothetical protein
MIAGAACALALLAGCLEVGGDAMPDEPLPSPEDAGEYVLQARHTAIRSYPGGGGVFTVFIDPREDFSGTVRLSVEADPLLHASLSRHVLDERERVAELRLAPSETIGVGMQRITVVAMHDKRTTALSLDVELLPWSQAPAGMEMEKREDFLTWLRTAHPELGDVTQRPFHRYMTYPEILIVEHWTFLSSDWEMRLCYHVMIPPHDWSMLLLRRCGSLSPLLAARRESDGSIHEIAVEQYPTLFDY